MGLCWQDPRLLRMTVASLPTLTTFLSHTWMGLWEVYTATGSWAHNQLGVAWRVQSVWVTKNGFMLAGPTVVKDDCGIPPNSDHILVPHMDGLVGSVHCHW
eukprot:TRINITY_DN66773_c3_g15_i1.p1 TRINITY_DN66773_c3_g15~~TRINITY_DN66773_c3_g15_i1.p1  ORF type:complete len:101 (-),score=0.38 TRINITY_DN66773_c3_g15_i1:9-311(-)